MGTTKIPEKYMHTCDGCGTKEETTNVSRPTIWSRLVLERDAHDFQGAAVADATVRRLLCSKCTDKVAVAMNAALIAAKDTDHA